MYDRTNKLRNFEFCKKILLYIQHKINKQQQNMLVSATEWSTPHNTTRWENMLLCREMLYCQAPYTAVDAQNRCFLAHLCYEIISNSVDEQIFIYLLQATVNCDDNEDGIR